MEYSSGNVTADVLQTKDVNGAVFYEHYQTGILTPIILLTSAPTLMRIC